MNKRFSLLLTVLIAAVMAFPVLSVAGNDAEVVDDTPTRYGFTPELHQVANPATEAICVDAGDFDGVNNDDLAIGFEGSIQLLKNNGASGSSFGMDLHQTLTVSDYYITRIKFADYDDDGDQDLIALGQSEYYMTGETGAGGPSIISMRIMYYQNSAGTFSLDDYQEFDDAYLYQALWYWSESKYDMDIGDVDGDGDIDTVVAWNADSDGVGGNGGEQMRITLIKYESGVLSNSTIQTITFAARLRELNPLLRIADFDADSNIDILFAYGGRDAGEVIIEASLFIMWHTGVGTTWGSPVNLDPNNVMKQGGVFGSIPYSMAVGEFGGNDLPDIAITNNRNGGTSPAFGDTGVFLLRGLTGQDFTDPSSAYSQIGDYMIRGMAVGDFDKIGRDDVVCFTKQDQTGPPDGAWHDAIDGYGLSLLGSRSQVPYYFYSLKVFETPSTHLPYQVIKDVAVGNFDNDAAGHDDVVYVGDVVRIGLTTFPPNNPPSKVRVTVTPSPVLNKDNFATINLTIEDLDGNWDLTKIEVDFTPIGLPLWVINDPEPDPNNETYGWYEFDIQVPPNVIQGDHEITFYMYDKNTDPPGKNVPKSNDTFLFRVKQYNRRPEIALSEANRTLYVKEDTPTYFEGIYDWFYDLDMDEGYQPDQLNISMRSFKSDTFVTTSTLESSERKLFRVDLKNGSAADPQSWSLLITPDPNFHHKEYEYNQMFLRAGDGLLYTDPLLRLTIVIVSENDNPFIPVQKRFDSDDDFEFSIDQGETTVSFALQAFDESDGQTPYLQYYFEYEDPTDEEWLYVSEAGLVSWFPENEHVGSHMVTLWVSDGIANISRVLYFNVSNINDAPFFVSISNGTTTISEIPTHIPERYEFIVNEHEEFNLTIIVDDLDSMIGLQESVNFRCNLTLLNNTYLDVDPTDPFKANFHFWAEKKFGYYATYEPETPPIDTEIIVTDGINQDIIVVLPIRIRIENVNDPPIFVSIDSPDEGYSHPILYNMAFSAGEALDPDTVYNDTLTYQWDFDASDGEFQAQFIGLNGIWDFPTAGAYMITLRIVDSAGNYLEVTRNVTVSGYKDDDDYDNDGMTNKWEDENGLDKYSPDDADVDSDGDGLLNYIEFLNRTDPRRRDTDGDGAADGEDFSPLDSTVWKEPAESNDNSINWILILIIIALVILIIAVVAVLLVLRSMKKSKEEEERRKKAEEMQRSTYEGQDLYADLPPTEQGQLPGTAEPAPDMPLLPPQEGAGLDDIFGGAGTLPTQEGAPQGLPPGPQEATAPQATLPAQNTAPPQGDVTELLDQ